MGEDMEIVRVTRAGMVVEKEGKRGKERGAERGGWRQERGA